MSAKILAEELLYLFWYNAELLAFPSIRKWDQSFEGWLYQNGLLLRMHYLEKQKLLERERTRGKAAWAYRLTNRARKLVRGDRNAQLYWNRAWDGWWRMILFDLPVGHQRLRVALLRWLRSRGCGYLQDSVWVTPDPVEDIVTGLKGIRRDAESFMLMESRCVGGYTNSALVAGAWRFDDIHKYYEEYRKFAAERIAALTSERLHPRDLFALLREERSRWARAFDTDPLLPRSLWPPDYLGPSCLEMRSKLLRALALQATPK